MAEVKSPRHRHPISEKRRIVELSLREGASIGAIAREQGVHPNSVRQWKSLYRAGQLDPASVPTPRGAGATSGVFVPVTITPVAHVAGGLSETSSVVQITLSSGTMLRIETGALESGLLCALVAQLQR